MMCGVRIRQLGDPNKLIVGGTQIRLRLRANAACKVWMFGQQRIGTAARATKRSAGKGEPDAHGSKRRPKNQDGEECGHGRALVGVVTQYDAVVTVTAGFPIRLGY